MKTARNIMIFLRVFYALLILERVFHADIASAGFHTVLFITTLAVPCVGKKEEYYVIDSFVVGLLMAAIFAGYFNLWNSTTVLGIDKLFHAVGGLILALFAAIVLKKYEKNRLLFAALIVSVALAIGAVWEVMEWFFTLLPAPFTTGYSSFGLTDAMLDLVADTFGAMIIAFWHLVR